VEQVEVLSQMLDESVNEWLKVSLHTIVETDSNGLIVRFRPTQKMSMGLVFYFQSLMIEQRLYLMDSKLKESGIIQ
jgi:hypothetical protein